MFRITIALLGLVCTSTVAEELPALTPEDVGGLPKEMMKRYLLGQAEKALAARDAEYEALQTPEQIAAYQKKRRDFFITQLGGFPERTPLNAQTVGKLDGDGCRIEKVIFESRPSHHVTAMVYLPPGKGPFPAVLIPCGHTVPGKASNQRLCTFFARSGIAALSYDPIGQGERFQLLDDAGKHTHQPTGEHTLVGVSSILVGRNTASYRIWDGIRALDYLQSRPDIDGKRLGCTGISGGGTMTEYLMALDDRILAAAPGCAPTTFRRRFATIGPGDAEQNIFGQVGFGMDHGDYSIMRAPRPTLLLTATRDFVDIEGSWDLFREVKRICTRLGYPERIELVEADEKHGFTQPLRIASVRWMRRWLLDRDDAVTEPEITTRSFTDLLCTPKGQVMLLPGERSVMDLNFDVVDAFAEHRKENWQPKNHDKSLAIVRNLTGIRKLSEIPRPTSRRLGVIKRGALTIEKWLLTVDEGVVLPALLYHSEKPNGPRVLYVHELGKRADEERIEKLAKAGTVVLAVDLRGTGETASTWPTQWGGSFNEIFTAYLLGKSFLGMRAEDCLVAGRFLAEWETELPRPVELIAVGIAGPSAIHAAALERDLFANLTLRDSITSWVPVVRDPTKLGQLVNAVHGALREYDLNDLIEMGK